MIGITTFEVTVPHWFLSLRRVTRRLTWSYDFAASVIFSTGMSSMVVCLLFALLPIFFLRRAVMIGLHLLLCCVREVAALEGRPGVGDDHRREGGLADGPVGVVERPQV